MKKNRIRVGIGFATGRQNFKKVLRTYTYSWRENELRKRENISLNLFVAYDLKYSHTRVRDFTSLSGETAELFDNIFFLGRNSLVQIRKELSAAGAGSRSGLQTLFGSGYSAKRNAILYTALQNKMDCLLFLDDDEYPLAVTNTRSTAVWGGQHVLSVHLQSIPDADITSGFRCGYISPVPFVTFGNGLSEADFRGFIEAISNDILDWDSMREVMDNGGVTYADPKVLVDRRVAEVPETNRCKFITGSNLCINLSRPERVLPFYNPPGARGEDTFLSTCLSDRRVLRVPCYTFHDGFGVYAHLMDGVLPTNLKYIHAGNEAVVERFYSACLGWVRYKPLFLYLTDPGNYPEKIRDTHEKLTLTLPKICTYFGCRKFMNLVPELERYEQNVKKHDGEFAEARETWERIIRQTC